MPLTDLYNKHKSINLNTFIVRDEQFRHVQLQHHATQLQFLEITTPTPPCRTPTPNST